MRGMLLRVGLVLPLDRLSVNEKGRGGINETRNKTTYSSREKGKRQRQRNG